MALEITSIQTTSGFTTIMDVSPNGLHGVLSDGTPYGLFTDGPLVVYKRADGTIFGHAPSSENYRFQIGDFNNGATWPLQAEALESPRDVLESRVNNRIWIFGTHAIGNTIWGVGHHEWYQTTKTVDGHAGFNGYLGPLGDGVNAANRRWVNSLVWLKSLNGGATWSVGPDGGSSSANTRCWLVTEPWGVQSRDTLYGLMTPSNVVKEGSFWYWFCSYYSLPGGTNLLDTGIIMMRTSNLDDVTVTQIWTATGWVTRVNGSYVGNLGQQPKVFFKSTNFNPYTTSERNERMAQCVRFHTPTNQWLIFGETGIVANCLCYCASATLANPQWENNGRQMISLAGGGVANDYIGNHYINVFDPASTDQNFTDIGDNPVLFRASSHNPIVVFLDNQCLYQKQTLHIVTQEVIDVVNVTPPSIALDSGYAGHYKGSKYTASPGTWSPVGTSTGNWQSNGVNIAGATGLNYTLTAAQEGLPLRYRETNAGVSVNSNSLVRPPLIPLDISTTTRAPPASAKPAYLVNTPEPTFPGVTITRISDNPGNSIGATAGVWGARVHHQYHKFPVWNADETLMFIEDNSEGGSSGMIMLDGQTYQVVSFLARPSGWREGRWDRLVPNRMVFVTTNSINYYNVTTGAVTLIRSFSGVYSNMYIGALKGEQSWDNDMWPIKATRVSDGANVVFPYTISTNTVGTVSVPETRFGKVMTLGQVTISPLKNFMYVNFDDETTVILDVTGTTLLQTWPEAQWPTHHTQCVDRSDGTNREYAWGAHNGDIVKRRLSDGVSITINALSYGYHTSACNYQGGAWLTNDYVDDSGNPYVGEQVIIAHDGSKVGRLCHNQRGVNIDYDNEPHGSISPTGKRIIFASTWRGAGTPSRPVQIYVADFRGASFGADTAPIINLDAGYAGHYAGSHYTCTAGIWSSGVATRQWRSNGVAIGGATGLTYVMTAAVEGTVLDLVETNGGATLTSNTLQRPALTNLLVDTNTYVMNTTAVLPAYQADYIDPFFGTKLRRISGDPGTQIAFLPAGQLWGNTVRPRSIQHSCWNSDETIMYLDTNTGGSSYMIFLDGQTYVPLAISAPPPALMGEVRWHETSPNLMIFCTTGTTATIKELNVQTAVNTTIHTFTGSYSNISFGAGNGEFSRNNDYMPVMATRVSDSHLVAFVYRRSTDAILGVIDLTLLAPKVVSICSVSPNGTYLVLVYTDDTMDVYSNAGVFVRSVTDVQKPSNFSMDYDTNGDEMMIGPDHSATPPGGGHIIKHRISDGVVTEICPNSYGYKTNATNHGGTNNDWVMSTYAADSGLPYVNELVCPAVNGSVRGRICHTQRGLVIDSANDTRPNLSRTGKRAAFQSAWRGASATPIYAFVVDFRDRQFPGLETGVNTKTVDITCTTTSARLRQMRKNVTIAATSSMTMLRSTQKRFDIVCTTGITILKALVKIIAITATSSIQSLVPIKNAGASTPKTITITATTSTSFNRRVGKGILITCTSSIAAIAKAIVRGINLTCTTILQSSILPSVSNRVYLIQVAINCLSSITPLSFPNKSKVIDITATTQSEAIKTITRTISLTAVSNVLIRMNSYITNLPISVRVIHALERMRLI